MTPSCVGGCPIVGRPPCVGIARLPGADVGLSLLGTIFIGKAAGPRGAWTGSPSVARSDEAVGRTACAVAAGRGLQLQTPRLGRGRAAAHFALGAVLVALAACGGDEGVGDPVRSDSSYRIESSFDVQGSFGDSGLGKVLDLLRDLSDGSDDPGRFLVDQVIERIPTPLNWTIKPVAPLAGREVNEVIYDLVPRLADEAKILADTLSGAARRFQLVSRLDVGIDASGRLTGTHTIERVVFALGDHRLELTRAELGEEATPVAARIAVRRVSDALIIPAHRLKLPIGTVLQRALERVALPAIASGLADMAELAARWFSCAAVVAEIADNTDNVDTVIIGALTSGCGEASKRFSALVTEELKKLDAHGELRLVGSTEAAADAVAYTGKGWGGSYRVAKDTAARLEAARNPFSLRQAEAAAAQ